MIIEQKSNNYNIAKMQADKVDEVIIETLQSGKSFRVEAGAGSGKTYSLKKVIEWIQFNKREEYIRKKQKVICITYTNAAVDVITERLQEDSFIVPSTIHAFAWNAIKQYQSFLIDIIKKEEAFSEKESDFFKVTEVRYTLGHRYIENNIQYLYHDDVIKLFCKLLKNDKFRKIFTDRFPLILIDEYQDSYKQIMDLFIDYFIAKGKGPQFGLFGDAWQTIYQSNKACGLIKHENLKEIKKVANFRSAPKIVRFLNTIRPELPQQSAIDGFDGEVVVITCDDYLGERRSDRNFKNELPAKELKERLNKLIEHIKRETSIEESLKVLMITHKVLATQQGYEKLLEVLDDGLKDKEDLFLLFFMNIVEPVYQALDTSQMEMLFDTIGVKRYPITRKSEKEKWRTLLHQLKVARSEKAIDVLKVIMDSKLVPVSPQIEWYYSLYYSAPDTFYSSNTTIESFLNLEYVQFLSAIEFLYPEAEFSTEHGVKGEEYDNVIFSIGKGWNQYQFETYAPMITGKVSIPVGKEASYERNRNLFYVCCSRPRKRLFLFISIPLESAFKEFLIDIVGVSNIYTLSQYLKTS